MWSRLGVQKALSYLGRDGRCGVGGSLDDGFCGHDCVFGGMCECAGSEGSGEL